MLTFRTTNIFFGTITGLLVLLDFRFEIPAFAYGTVVSLYVILLVYGSYSIGSNFFMKVLCSGNTNEKVIAISFDDGPADQYTADVLGILKQQDVPATFFCIGKRVTGKEELLCRIHAEGHIIGNHSYSHSGLFDILPSKRMLKDIRMADMAIMRAIGIQPKWFRPPYGVTTPAMRRAVDAGGYTPIGWTVRSLDTVAKNEEKLLSRLASLLKPGAVILFHDTQKITLSILPRFIQAARNEGYEFIRLDKMLNVKWYA